MKLGKALKIALSFAEPKADVASSSRYVRVVPHVWGAHPQPVFDPEDPEGEPLLWIPEQRGFVYAFNGRCGVRILLEHDDAHVRGDIGIDAEDLRRVISVSKDSLTHVMVGGAFVAFLHTGNTALQVAAVPGERVPTIPLPGKLHAFPDVALFAALTHAASTDEADRSSLCGVRLAGTQAEAADEHRIAVVDVDESPIAPVVFPTRLFKGLPRSSKILPCIALEQGFVFLHMEEQLRFAVAEDRKFPLPERPKGFEYNVTLPREAFANAARFAVQTSHEDICEIATEGGLVRVAGCRPGALASREEFSVPIQLPLSSRVVRGRLLHQALLAFNESDAIELSFSTSPLLPVRLRSGAYSELIWPLEFPTKVAA